MLAAIVSLLGADASRAQEPLPVTPDYAPPDAVAQESLSAVSQGLAADVALIPTVEVGGTWVPLGPAATLGGQVTVPPNNEIGGAIQAMAIHPTNPSIIYIGAVNGGIWRTANGTAASPVWMVQTDSLPSLSIGSLEFDPTDATSQTLVAGSARLSSYGAVGGARIGV